MARPIQIKNVGNQVIAASGSTINTSLPAPSVFAPTFPVGDMLVQSVHVRLYGNENNVGAGSGTAVSDGPMRLARSITFETDKHGKIIDGVDGLSLDLLQALNRGTRGYQTLGSLAAAGTPSFEGNVKLDFATAGAFRPYDSALDLRFARPTLTFQAGLYADLNNAGFATTNDIQNLAYNVSMRILNGPVKEPSSNVDLPETPDFMRYVGVKKYVSTATTTGATIDLTWGDRIFKKLIVTQRNTAAASLGVLLANTVVSGTAPISLLVNSFPWTDRVQNAQMQAENKTDFSLETVPSGWTTLDFDSTSRYADYLSVLSRDAGIVQLQLDVTGVASSELWIIQDCYKAIPDAALRASQLALRGN